MWRGHASYLRCTVRKVPRRVSGQESASDDRFTCTRNARPTYPVSRLKIRRRGVLQWAEAGGQQNQRSQPVPSSGQRRPGIAFVFAFHVPRVPPAQWLLLLPATNRLPNAVSFQSQDRRRLRADAVHSSACRSLALGTNTTSRGQPTWSCSNRCQPLQPSLHMCCNDSGQHCLSVRGVSRAVGRAVRFGSPAALVAVHG